MQLVTGGQTAISINGEVGPYFRNKRGVRQGDPSSPLLFNFMADSLARMLDLASAAGHIHGVVPHLIEGGVAHLQYADDTIILVQNVEEELINLKLILLCFEIISGLKINFLKSEVIVLGASPQEQARVANLLNCKTGFFPFTYLGFPIADRKLTSSDWEPLVGVVGHRNEPWQGRFMSSAARLTLTNSSLAILPLHAMSLFLLNDGTHAGFRKHMSTFFWEGANANKKYHMVRWEEVCRPKDQGGLGIINTKSMNVALMVKWIWRLLTDPNPNALWIRLIHAKYPGATNIFTSSAEGGSQFWHALHKVKPFFKLGARYTLGTGSSILFWKDWWTGESPLADRYSRLFEICSNPEILISQAHQGDGWHLRFRRTFGREELALWQQLFAEIGDLEPSSEADLMRWALEPSALFSVSSLYYKLLQTSEEKVPQFLWAAKLPHKIKIFLWLRARGRLPAGDQLKLRHVPSDGYCSLCGEWEDTNHIFFSCVFAKLLWSGFRESFGLLWNPQTFDQFWALLLAIRPADRKFVWLLFSAQSWALWNIRNKFTIESVFPNQAADCFFKSGILLQQWRPLSKPEDHARIDVMISQLKNLYRTTRSNGSSSS